jgi:cell division protein FtsQ
VVLAVALVLAPGGWLLLRHSPLVSVQRVQVSGVHGPEAAAIDAALVAAGRHMSTLDVRTGALLAAVAPFRVVREVHATAGFPHALRIRVVEQLPVAALSVAGTRTAVAADGMVLGPALLTGSLPALDGSYAPAAGKRVSDPTLLAALTVLGAAPAPLAKLISRVLGGPKGVTLAIGNGLLAYFGDGSRPHAKWLSLARVLADPSSSGASYVDVRLPERPAAGFPSGTSPPLATSGGSTPANTQQTSTSEAAVAALAAGLPSGAPTGGESASGASSGGSPTGAAPAETSGARPAETSGATPGEASAGAQQGASGGPIEHGG